MRDSMAFDVLTVGAGAAMLAGETEADGLLVGMVITISDC